MYYALSYENSDGTQEQSIHTRWNLCQYAMTGKMNIHVKKFNTLEQAEVFLKTHQKNPSNSSPIHMKTPFHISKQLTDEQKTIMEFILTQTESCFITGPAGTGKSFVVKEIVRWLTSEGVSFGITGSTGASAVLIGGKTLHSFMGLGLGNKSASAYAESMKAPLKRRLIRLDTLILDEISMISDALLNKIDALLKILRKSNKPFGGVRMIFIGDACQLPPVEGDYFFKSDSWKQLNPHVFSLTRLIRQDKDTCFQEMLMRLRWGKCNEEDYKRLKECQSKKWPETMRIQPTRLYATNVDVDTENEKAFSELIEQYLDLESDETLSMQSYPIHYMSIQASSPKNKYLMEKIKRWMQSSRISENLNLCKGAQVMVTWNINVEAGIVNGTRGVVKSVFPDHVDIERMDGTTVSIGYVQIDYENTDELESDSTPPPGIQFMPLKLAYALTIHKCQGVTLDCAEIYLGEDIFEYGQAYTALSRVKNLESIKISGLSKKAFRTHPDVVSFYNS
jgi:ATP-dependent DNA helicase PIF1